MGEWLLYIVIKSVSQNMPETLSKELFRHNLFQLCSKQWILIDKRNYVSGIIMFWLRHRISYFFKAPVWGNPIRSSAFPEILCRSHRLGLELTKLIYIWESLFSISGTVWRPLESRLPRLANRSIGKIVLCALLLWTAWKIHVFMFVFKHLFAFLQIKHRLWK